ncbi:MAG: DUF5916 domain-containing protein [Chitinophagales bacterium]
MKRTLQLFFSVFFFLPFTIQAQTVAESDNDTLPKISEEKRIYTTKRIEGASPTIDGKFDEACWETVEWTGDYVQWKPYNAKAPTAQTQFKVLYDDKYIYFAYRCFDDPEKIVRRMSRRDGFEGDWVEINIDSYFDKQTAFSFTISVSGVKGDEAVTNNGNNWDGSWDPIWYTKTAIDDKGWTAEVKIPLSQLRFANKEVQVWGLQSTRRVFRAEERSTWQYVPLNESGWVHRFGELHGLEGIKPQKQIELEPYILAQTETFEKEEGNPFATGSDSNVDVGLNGKIGVTSDLTLDFTVNPDFGQVEADPSVVNIDGFAVFFQERRPFFIEGRNIFDYQLTPAQADGPYSSDNLFYSRRIGRSPHHYPDVDDDAYINQPVQTSIIGAAKLSGKTKKGLSIGILESVTSKEEATIALPNDDEQTKTVVEPLTNYFVARVAQDFNERNSQIGGIFTAVNRSNIDQYSELNFLRKNAYTGGVDFIHRWKDQSRYISGNLLGSYVNGSTESITETQESFIHNFQRPDADYIEIDTTRTSMTGTAGTLRLGKVGGDLVYEGGLTWRSPSLEMNDIGFQQNSDYFIHFLWAGYRITEPFGIFYDIRFNYNHWFGWDMGGTFNYQANNINAHANFKNFWSAGMGIYLENYWKSDRQLRGGPYLRMSPGMNWWGYLNTNQRKKLQLSIEWNKNGSYDGSISGAGLSMNLNYQPIHALKISVGPSYGKNVRETQYVDNVDYGNDVRYITAKVNQDTYSLTTRVDYTILPNLTLQFWGQPFISKGEYTDFKRITDNLATDISNRFYTFAPSEINFNSEDEEFVVDENQDGTTDYTFGNPDFNYLEFRSNFVARWEYIPGSTIFLVWSQNRGDNPTLTDRSFGKLTSNLFDVSARNTFLLKFTYRFLK